MTDVKVSLLDGSYHEVDSSDLAFKVAGSLAFKKLAQQARPIALEPIMSLEIVLPEEFLGDVLGNLNARRARIQGLEPHQAVQVVRAEVPLAEMFGYATDLRSLTQGRATYTMQFLKYMPLPPALTESLVSRRQGADTRCTSKKKEVA